MKFNIFIILFLLISQSNFILNEILRDQDALKKSVDSLDKNSALNVDSAKGTSHLNENEEGIVADEENDNQINLPETNENNLDSDDKTTKLLPETKLEVHHVNESDNNVADNLKGNKNSDESILEETKQKVIEYAQTLPTMEEIKETISEHVTVPSKLKETLNEAKDLVEEKLPSFNDIKEKTKDAYEATKEKVKEYTDKIPTLDEAKETIAEKVPSYDDLKEKVESVAKDTKENIIDQATLPTILKEAKDKIVDKLEETRDKIPSLDELKEKAQDFISEHATVPSVVENVKDKAQEVYEKTKEYVDNIPSMEEAREKVEDFVEKTKEKVADYAANVPSMEDVKEKTNEWMDQVKEKTSDSSQVTQASTIQEVTERTKELNEEIRKERENDESLIDKSKKTIEDFASKLPSMDEVKEKVGDFVEKQKDNLNLAKEYAENLYVTVDDVADEEVENAYILETEKPVEMHPADRMEEIIEKSLEFDDYFDALVKKLRERFHIIDLGQYINPTYLGILFIYIALSFVYLIQYFYKKRRETQQASIQTDSKTDKSKLKNGKKFYPPAPKIK